MGRRTIRKPNKFGEWEESSSLKIKKENIKEKLWEIDDILESRGENEDREVRVRWAKWQGEPSWVKLSYNPELTAFLRKNVANPESCSLYHSMRGNDTDIQALKQAIFDSLGDARRTPDGTIGLQRRVAIKLPFRANAFLESFGRLKKINTSTSNTSTNITLEELRLAIGEGFDRRGYKTSTETFISAKELVHVSWGYKSRINFEHSNCTRCNWAHEEYRRPELCNASQQMLFGPPWLTLTFTRGRKNNVTGSVSKRRKPRQ